MLALACPLLAGCASAPRDWDAGASAPQTRDRSVLVFETDEARLASGDTLAFERWEFARNDARTNIIRPVPLAATRAWPQPPKPAERRIRFSDWQQR